MPVLPDSLGPNLRVVFCGTAVGKTSASVGHYYAGPGNEFWGTLHEVGLITEPLGAHLDCSMSGANRGTGRLEGKSSRADWFHELAQLEGPARRRARSSP
jgi:G:T/U-mismatch repair DNA glycosylase